MPEASLLKVSSRLDGELAPKQRWRPAQLAPRREVGAYESEFAPTRVL
jgi:hypothetical protein